MARLAALISCLLAVSPAAVAETPLQLRFTSAPKEVKRAQRDLGKWLRACAKREFAAKIETITRRRLISLAVEAPSDLRDAVADTPQVLKNKASSSLRCQSLELCPSVLGMTHARSVSDAPDSLAALIQPWLLLQHRRGGRLVLAPVLIDSDVIMTMSFEGLVSGPIEIHASPDSSGGLQLWLSSGSDLDEVYAFSRDALLSPSKLPRDVAPSAY